MGREHGRRNRQYPRRGTASSRSWPHHLCRLRLGPPHQLAGGADYAGTKAAIAGFSRGAARDLGPRNITVNVVEAGIMETDMTMALAANGIPEGLFSLMSIGRLAQLEEVAAAVVFLATPAASYITGSVIEANGGYMA